MLHLDLNTRKRVILLNRAGYSSSEICHRLREEDIIVTVRGVNRLLQKFRRYGCIRDLPHRKRQRIIREEMRKVIDEMMEADELTSTKLRSQLVENNLHSKFLLT